MNEDRIGLLVDTVGRYAPNLLAEIEGVANYVMRPPPYSFQLEKMMLGKPEKMQPVPPMHSSKKDKKSDSRIPIL